MRFSVIGLLVIFGLQGFAQSPGVELNITLTSKDVKGKVYLEKLNDRGFADKIDSAAISSANFVFDAKIPEPGIYQLNIADGQLIGLLLDGGEKLTIKADGVTTDDKAATASVSGSDKLSVYQELQNGHFAFVNKVKEIDGKFKASAIEATRQKLRDEYLGLVQSYNTEILEKVKSLGTSAAGILATNNFLDKGASEAYFEELASKLQAEGKKYRLAQMFVQSVNQGKMGLPGIPAPDFEVKDLEGKTLKLSDLKGKKVILDFWATWCGPCIMSFPGMKKAMDKYEGRDDVVFVYINTFERVAAEKTNDHVKNFVTNRGLTYLNTMMDQGSQIAYLYGVDSIPAKFFIDKDGKFLHKSRGYAGSEDAVVQEISQWLD
jgi:thiol-disulfide isomerase/thioredoxin